MEDDDEFGDLYTDVISSFQSQRQENNAQGCSSKSTSFRVHPIDLNINSDDKEILFGAQNPGNSNSSCAPGLKLNVPIQEKTLPELDARPEPRGFDFNLDSDQGAESVEGLSGNGGGDLESEVRISEKGEGVNVTGRVEEDDYNITVEEKHSKDNYSVENDENLMRKNEKIDNSTALNENTVNFVGENEVGETDLEPMIPGLSGTVENLGGENFEDELDSEESEDDLLIVLNDNGHGPVRTEDEDGEDGEQLVIFADHPQPMMEEQKLDSDEPGAEGERKELGDTTIASEGGGAATTSLQLKIGYNNHAYHHPFHSQFKYVRPGAAPMPGAAPVVPVTIGRGGGDCRPEAIKGAGPMQKGFHPGYGMPAWGANTAGRGFCSGLEFTLPSHKTIFEVDIDSFEEKPWQRPRIDISYFFNFSLNEESWKDYCKQLEQLRLGTSMQSKIRVYESGRTGQEYDPDLPPELAAAVGIQDIPSKNTNPGKTDVGTKDLARAHGRPPLPVGRPIPVETGLGDRLPSIETRRPRMHDLDAIIEIVYQTDDDDVAEQQEDDPLREDLRGIDETDDLQQDDTDRHRGFSHTNDGKKRDLVGRREKFMNSVCDDEVVEDDILHIPSEEPVKYHPCRELGVPREERCTEGRGIVKSSNVTASSIKREKIMDYQEESFDSGDGKLSPLSSPISIGSVGEQTVGDSDMNHKTLVEDRSFEIDREKMALDEAKIDTLEEENLMHSTQKQPSQDNDNREDSNAARSSENCKARSESSKDHWKFDDSVEDEVLQNKCSMRTDSVQRPVVDEDSAHRRGCRERRETGTHHKGVKGRENSYVYRTGDLKSSLHRHAKSESTDRRKESDISEGRCHQRDESPHGRSNRVGDSRKREHGWEIESRHRSNFGESERSKRNEHHEPRKQLDNGCWRSARHDKDMGSMDEQSCNEKVVDVHRKRRKEEARVNQEHAETEEILHNHRESNSSRRKRERDDSSDQQKRDEQARLKDDDLHNVGKKEKGSFQGEKSERQRGRDEWNRLEQSHDEILMRRQREETRAITRSSQAAEDRAWANHARGKAEYKGPGRQDHSKYIDHHNEQLKRRDQVENGSFSHLVSHDDVYAHGNKLRDVEKRARRERPTPRNKQVPYASDASRVPENKHKESSRKSKESESGDRSSMILSRRKQDELSRQISETVNFKGRTGQESGENEIHMNLQSSRKHREGASSDDEKTGSMRGSSKLERWTGNNERDFSIISKSSSSLKSKDIDTHKKVSDQPLRSANQIDTGGAQVNNADEKTKGDKHLDTFAKLKKRSERFKLPMPSDKDVMAIKKMECEPLPSAQTETRPDPEIKLGRPARKRRWTDN